MKIPIFIRPLTEQEQQRVQAGLRAKDAFVLRRCQILLASARGERAISIARQLGCGAAFGSQCHPWFHYLRSGRAARRLFVPPSSAHQLFGGRAPAAQGRGSHRRPSDFGKERSTWTLELAAQVSFEQGIVATPISDESVRRALKRLKTNWKRAKHWITSPDPQYPARKKRMRSADRLGQWAT
jgi:hypothetical protein